MDNHLWRKVDERRSQSLPVRQISNATIATSFQFYRGKEARLGWWIQSIASYLGAHLRQHICQPRTFKSRVTREKNPSIIPEL